MNYLLAVDISEMDVHVSSLSCMIIVIFGIIMFIITLRKYFETKQGAHLA